MKKTGILIFGILILFVFAISISEVRAGEVKFKNRTIATTMAIMAFVPHLTDGNIEIETGDESVLVSQMSEKGKLTPRENRWLLQLK